MCIFVGVVKEMWERQHGKQVRGGGHGMGENGNGGTIIMRRLGILIAAVAAALAAAGETILKNGALPC